MNENVTIPDFIDGSDLYEYLVRSGINYEEISVSDNLVILQLENDNSLNYVKLSIKLDNGIISFYINDKLDMTLNWNDDNSVFQEQQLINDIWQYFKPLS